MPKVGKFQEQQKWSEIGVIVWNALISRVTHLHGSQAIHILDHVQKSDTWKKEGLLVGEVAYYVIIPSNKKSKKRSEYQPEMKPILILLGINDHRIPEYQFSLLVVV